MEVALGGKSGAEMGGFAGQPNKQRTAIDTGIYGDAPDAQFRQTRVRQTAISRPFGDRYFLKHEEEIVARWKTRRPTVLTRADGCDVIAAGGNFE